MVKFTLTEAVVICALSPDNGVSIGNHAHPVPFHTRFQPHVGVVGGDPAGFSIVGATAGGNSGTPATGSENCGSRRMSIPALGDEGTAASK